MIEIIMMLGDVYNIHVGDRTILDVDGVISFTLSQKTARQGAVLGLYISI